MFQGLIDLFLLGAALYAAGWLLEVTMGARRKMGAAVPSENRKAAAGPPGETSWPESVPVAAPVASVPYIVTTVVELALRHQVLDLSRNEGRVVLSFYPGDRVERSFRPCAKLARTMGSRVPLPPLVGVPEARLKEVTVQDVRSLLGLPSKTETVPRKLAVRVEEKREGVAFEPAPSPDVPREGPNKGPSKRPPAAEAVYVGELAYARPDMRKQGLKKPYSSYCVAIYDKAQNGAINEFWGTDLQRAIDDSHARPGDIISVSMTGATQVPIKERDPDGTEGQKLATKRLWHVQVLNPAPVLA